MVPINKSPMATKSNPMNLAARFLGLSLTKMTEVESTDEESVWSRGTVTVTLAGPSKSSRKA